MSKNLLVAFAGGVVCISVAIVFIFHAQRGAHVELTGKILKVRTISVEDNAAIAVVDFRVTNPADYRFMADKVLLTLIDATGKRTEGTPIAEIDAVRVFEGLPLLGPKYNPTLGLNGIVLPHAMVDRMTSARFELPDLALQSRMNMILHIDEVDGRAQLELTEK